METAWTILVTEEQKEAIGAFFVHWDWDLVEIPSETPRNEADLAPATESLQEDEDENEDGVNALLVHAAVAELAEDRPVEINPPPAIQQEIEELPDLDPVVPVPVIAPLQGANECLHCFCSPCVLHFPQRWFGNGQPPHARNSAIRKGKYKKFWKMLSDRGAWYDRRYIEKKEQRSRDDNFTVWSVREIMPDCVVTFVRGLYPNLSGVPYMGHKWQ